MAAIATNGNGLGSVTTILDSDAVVADQAALDAISVALQNAGHTVAGIDGALAGVMHFAVQGGPDASGYAAEVMGQALSAVCTFN
jgi:hypothetical protein|tara:strand:+ start:301 stop:555 length:255 start_codon:yes stop_codon:yes gene_type:complete